MSVDVIHLEGLAVDQVLVKHVIVKQEFPFAHVRLFAFNPANGYSADLLNVGAAGDIAARPEDGALSIVTKLADGQCPGCSDSLSLRFDKESQRLAIQSPAGATVGLHKYLLTTAQSFTN